MCSFCPACSDWDEDSDPEEVGDNAELAAFAKLLVVPGDKLGARGQTEAMILGGFRKKGSFR